MKTLLTRLTSSKRLVLLFQRNQNQPLFGFWMLTGWLTPWLASVMIFSGSFYSTKFKKFKKLHFFVDLMKKIWNFLQRWDDGLQRVSPTADLWSFPGIMQIYLHMQQHLPMGYWPDLALSACLFWWSVTEGYLMLCADSSFSLFDQPVLEAA